MGVQKSAFITFEGGEGSGKSTQIKRLAKRLKDRGLPVVTTREPGGTPGAEEIRKLLVEGEPGRWLPITETLLIAAARADHVNRLIKPKLADGNIVLSDRFYDSSLAYQGTGLGLGVEKVLEIQKMAFGDFKPDLTLILDVPTELGLNRAVSREVANGSNEDRYEKMGDSFHDALHETYMDIARTEPERCRIIDASGTMDEIEDDIWHQVSTFLKLDS